MKQIFIFSLAICIFGNVFAHTNYLSDLKNSLLYNYDRTTKPFEHVTVNISVRPVNLKLCPHSQVTTKGEGHRRMLVGRIAARISRIKRVSLHKKYGAPVFIAAVFLLFRTTTLETFFRGSVMMVL